MEKVAKKQKREFDLDKGLWFMLLIGMLLMAILVSFLFLWFMIREAPYGIWILVGMILLVIYGGYKK